MKFKMFLSALGFAAALASTSANAAAFYVQDYNDPLQQTGTAMELSLNWTAISTYTDTNNNGVIDFGDAVVDRVAINRDGVNNIFGSMGLIPDTAEDSGGIGSVWDLFFDYEIFGTVIGVDPLQPNSIAASYASGLINVYYDDRGDRIPGNAARSLGDPVLLTLEVTGSELDGANFNLFTKVTFAEPDVFFFGNDVSFNSLVGTETVISATIDTNIANRTIPVYVNGTATRSSRLDGSASFEVPEPGIVALLGLGLIGIGAARRYKKTA